MVPEDWQIIPNAIEKAREGKKVIDGQYRIIRPDGEQRLVHACARLYKDENTGNEILVGTVHDITELKLAETKLELQKLTEYLDTTLLNLPAGLAILEAPDFRYFRINHTLAAINGQSIEEHLGRPLAEVIPDAAPDIVPGLKKVLETGIASTQR